MQSLAEEMKEVCSLPSLALIFKQSSNAEAGNTNTTNSKSANHNTNLRAVNKQMIDQLPYRKGINRHGQMPYRR
jgi:hypothetical protein